jgi:hypothetical protein
VVKLFLLLILPLTAWAQTVAVYSEFARIDKFGEVFAPETPREILSPAIARNAFTSFQVVVKAASGTEWRLYVGQNPENAVRVTMYRESGDALEPVDLPFDSEGTQVFWMDVWTGRDAPVARIKVEPEIFVNGDWVIYPMEARVMEARVAEVAGAATPVCPLKESPTKTPVAALQFRNAIQDGALAAQAPKDEIENLHSFCDTPTPSNAQRFWTERYLRIRDYLFRLR